MVEGGGKCHIIHLAAAAVEFRSPPGAPFTDMAQVALILARFIRVSRFEQASACSAELGDPASNDPILVDELRSRAHDIKIQTMTGAGNHFFSFQSRSWIPLVSF